MPIYCWQCSISPRLHNNTEHPSPSSKFQTKLRIDSRTAKTPGAFAKLRHCNNCNAQMAQFCPDVPSAFIRCASGDRGRSHSQYLLAALTSARSKTKTTEMLPPNGLHKVFCSEFRCPNCGTSLKRYQRTTPVHSARCPYCNWGLFVRKIVSDIE